MMENESNQMPETGATPEAPATEAPVEGGESTEEETPATE